MLNRASQEDHFQLFCYIVKDSQYAVEFLETYYISFSLPLATQTKYTGVQMKQLMHCNVMHMYKYLFLLSI